MKLCNDVMTVFNARVDPALRYEVYAPTVLRGVRWYVQRAVAVAEGGLKVEDRLLARIPADVDAGGRTYAEPRKYRAAAKADGLWTLQPGDILVRGEAAEACAPAELRERYGEVYTVSVVADNRSAPRGKHWRIEGR